jgi:hypothetical protein
MNPKEISKFANERTFTHNRTIIKKKDGTEIVGFFEGNDLQSEINNSWCFVKTPINENEKHTILDGNDISSIEIIDLRD